jgi:hypothetical protein
MKDRYILDSVEENKYGGVDQSIEVERVSESWTKIGMNNKVERGWDGYMGG